MYTKRNPRYTELSFSHMKGTSLGIKIKLNRNSRNQVISTELKLEDARKLIIEWRLNIHTSGNYSVNFTALVLYSMSNDPWEDKHFIKIINFLLCTGGSFLDTKSHFQKHLIP